MISLKNVYKSYGGQSVLSDFSAEFPDGSKTAIMGRSGAGKTTVINLILGLIKPDQGEIIRPQGRIGAVFQEDRLIEQLSAAGNLASVMKKPDRETAAEILAEMGIDNGLEIKPVSGLSGGEKRRVAIARALIIKPDALILDEPFKGIDRATLPSVVESVLRRAEGKTLITVTHSIEEAGMLGCGIKEIKT